MGSNLKPHFTLMAGYNSRMNNQVYDCATKLTASQLTQNRGAFFGSIFNTLNHILVGDLLWLRRFQNHPSGFESLKTLKAYPSFVALDHVPYDDFSNLYQARKEIDLLIQDWINNDLKEKDFDSVLHYTDTKGNDYAKDFAELLFHFFNHQTHHRGQVSTLLMQFGHDIGTTDFLIDIPPCTEQS